MRLAYRVFSNIVMLILIIKLKDNQILVCYKIIDNIFYRFKIKLNKKYKGLFMNTTKKEITKRILELQKDIDKNNEKYNYYIIIKFIFKVKK